MKKFIYEERSIGKLILLIGVLLAVPLLVLPFYPEDAVYIPAFLIPALFSILLGLGIGCLLYTSSGMRGPKLSYFGSDNHCA